MDRYRGPINHGKVGPSPTYLRLLPPRVSAGVSGFSEQPAFRPPTPATVPAGVGFFMPSARSRAAVTQPCCEKATIET